MQEDGNAVLPGVCDYNNGGSDHAEVRLEHVHQAVASPHHAVLGRRAGRSGALDRVVLLSSASPQPHRTETEGRPSVKSRAAAERDFDRSTDSERGFRRDGPSAEGNIGGKPLVVVVVGVKRLPNFCYPVAAMSTDPTEKIARETTGKIRRDNLIACLSHVCMCFVASHVW